MSMHGVTFDERSDVTRSSLDLMREYIRSEHMNEDLTASKPTRQYLLKKLEGDEIRDVVEANASSEYFILEEAGEIEKGRIEPGEGKSYSLVYRNNEVVEKEIEWEEARELIS